KNSLDLDPLRADDGYERPSGGPEGPRERPEVPRLLVELRGPPGPGEVELLSDNGAGDLRLADTSLDVELGRQSAVRREERAEDEACSCAWPELDVASGEQAGEVIRGIGVATEVAPEAAPRAGGASHSAPRWVDEHCRRSRQQTGVDLEPWRAGRVVGEDHELALVVHVAVARIRGPQRRRAGGCPGEAVYVDVDRLTVGADRRAVDHADHLPRGDPECARITVDGALAEARPILDR